MPHEPIDDGPYVSIFIPHFLGNPAGNDEICRKLYLEFGLTAPQIAKITGWSVGSLKAFFKDRKIFKEGKVSPWPMYGERKVGGRFVPHLGEQKIIARILELRKQGKSQQYITDLLNIEAIPAKNGGKWHRTMVQNILYREQKEKK